MTPDYKDCVSDPHYKKKPAKISKRSEINFFMKLLKITSGDLIELH